MKTEARLLPFAESNPRLWLVLALCVAAIMPSHDSLWIDEAQTVVYARQPTFEAWQSHLLGDRFSEAQMPLGMAVAWIAAKILGTTEWQLRAVNFIWTATAIWIVWLIGKRLRAPALALVLALHPFVWFYANEARPYALQIAGGACLLWAGFEFFAQNGRGLRWVILWALAAFILCGSSMLGVIPVAVVSVWLAVALFHRRYLPPRGVWLVAGAATLPLSLLGCYYAWTLKQGAGGASIWPVGVANLAFSAYEMLGFAGLGPARQQLRDAGASGTLFPAFRPFLLPVALLGLTSFFVLNRSLRWFRKAENGSFRFFLFGVPVICALFLFALAEAVHFPFWGRHLAPILPFVVVSLGLPILLSRNLLVRVMGVVWISLLLISSLELRFATRHGKDDNRSAAAIAQAAVAEGKTVWWSADRRSGEYYGLKFRANPEATGVVFLPGMSEADFNAQLPPDLILTSKPEIFDFDGRVARYVTARGYVPRYKVQAITGWAKP